MPDYKLHINGKEINVSSPEDTPLIWVLRDILGLKGTKYGCGVGICGSCVIHIDGESARSCVVPVSSCVGKRIITIEGLSEKEEHPIQKAWREERVPQCGYCQTGQIMQLAALLSENPNPKKEDIDASMSTVLCRCGTYPRIKKAIARITENSKE